jgi:hypothetical protein
MIVVPISWSEISMGFYKIRAVVVCVSSTTKTIGALQFMDNGTARGTIEYGIHIMSLIFRTIDT